MYRLQPFKAHIDGYEVIVDRENKVGYIEEVKQVSGLSLEDTFFEVGRILLESYCVSPSRMFNYWEMIDGEY